MGYTTDFIGSIGIEPRLNEAEILYLAAFSDSRRYDRQDGPFAVPGNPWAETFDDVPAERLATIAAGQPSSWCEWSPCLTGCCLSYTGMEKFYSPDAWIRYLITHFLQPSAVAAQGRRLAQFKDFTFDHRLNGLIVGCRRDSQELFGIEVMDNEVSRRTIVPGEDDEYRTHPALPYQEEIDRWARTRWRHRPDPKSL